MPVGEVHKQPQPVWESVQDLFRIPKDAYGKLNQSKSGQAPKKMTERQNWIQDNFNFLKTHVRRKGLSWGKSSAFMYLFLGSRQETFRTDFCNHQTSEVEALEERDFQMFRNEAVKLLSGIYSRAEETVSPSNLHFVGAPMPLPPMCHRLSAATATKTRCQEIHLDCSRNPDTSKPGYPTSSAEPSGTQMTAAAKRAADFRLQDSYI